MRAYRTEGKDPAGRGILPGLDVCSRKRRHIKIITRQGKRTTSPTGTETDESPFSRMRRRRKVKFDETFSVSLDVSLRFGKGGEEGIRFLRF